MQEVSAIGGSISTDGVQVFFNGQPVPSCNIRDRELLEFALRGEAYAQVMLDSEGDPFVSFKGRLLGGGGRTKSDGVESRGSHHDGYEERGYYPPVNNKPYQSAGVRINPPGSWITSVLPGRGGIGVSNDSNKPSNNESKDSVSKAK